MRVNYRVEKWRQFYAPNPAMLRYWLEQEGFSVFHWFDRPDAVYPVHSHGEVQSHWIISGSLELTIENWGTIVLETGDRDFMPANTYHSARVVGDEPVHYLIGVKQ